ncbi:hypothetical protein SLS58_009944 [Diplodia intermedia]|uniref:Uncharacterized protein n=1 Tax=Diplodia intermedia TaxID=856260 RepID=A0ABR3T9Z9_9PEZI
MTRKKTRGPSDTSGSPAGTTTPLAQSAVNSSNWTFSDTVHRSRAGSHSARRIFTVSMDPEKKEPSSSAKAASDTPTPAQRKKHKSKSKSKDKATAKSKVRKPVEVPRVRASTPFLFEAWENRTTAKGLREQYPYAFRCDGQPLKDYRKKFEDMRAEKKALSMIAQGSIAQPSSGSSAQQHADDES